MSDESIMNTGYHSRGGEPIHYGDTVESVQGTSFTVVKHKDGYPVLETDGQQYCIEDWMQQWMWITNSTAID